MSQRSFLQAQILETDRLLSLAGNHPLMSPGLKQRRAELEAELRNAAPAAGQARATLYFAGGPVVGSTGMEADFAARALEPFLRMVRTQYSARKHEAVGRPAKRDESESKLLLTSLPRGSSGLELVQLEPPNQASPKMLAGVLEQLAAIIEAAGASDDAFAASLEDASPRLLPPLRDLVKVMNERQADFRVVTGDREFRLPRASMPQAFERVADTLSDEVEVDKVGTFRGLTLDSWRFGFRPEQGDSFIESQISPVASQGRGDESR